jgi:hypothetical protein
LGNEERAGDRHGYKDHAETAYSFSPDEGSADHDKEGRYLENCRDITNGHVVESQDETDDGDDLEERTQKDPGIENAMEVATIAEQEDKRYTP